MVPARIAGAAAVSTRAITVLLFAIAASVAAGCAQQLPAQATPAPTTVAMRVPTWTPTPDLRVVLRMFSNDEKETFRLEDRLYWFTESEAEL